MSLRWLVYSGAEQLGPWSASRIRDELRAGRIDPFDMVATEGSQIKRPIVEVDEIFDTARIQPAAIVAGEPENRRVASSDLSLLESQTTRPNLKVVKESDDDGKTDENSSPKLPANDESSSQFAVQVGTIEPPKIEALRPRTYEALASKDAVTATQKVGNTRLPAAKPENPGIDTKRYVLWRTGQASQGPYSSKEILALWQKKQITSDCFVQRLGNSKRIGIQQFVRFYEKNSPSRSAVLRQALLVMKAKTAASWWLTMAIVIAVIIIVSAFFFSTSLTLNGPILDENPNSEALQNAPEKLEQPVQSLAPEAQPTSPEKPSQADKKPAAMTTLPKSKTAQKRPQVPRKKVRANQQLSSPRYPNKPTSVAPSNVVIAPLPPTQSRPAMTAAPSAGSAPVVPGAAPGAAPVAASASASGLADGASVTLTNYSFNLAQLNACDVKCKIPMNGPKGPVTAVFFKEAFGAAFANKSARVTVTGTVRKDAASGAVQILVQDVK